MNKITTQEKLGKCNNTWQLENMGWFLQVMSTFMA